MPDTTPVTLKCSARDEYSWPDTGNLAVYRSSIPGLSYRWYASRNLGQGGVLDDGRGSIRAFGSPQEAAAAIGAKLP